MIFYFKHTTKNSIAALILLLSIILMSAFVSDIATNQGQAETGKGKDIFKVIMTIFGVDKG